MSFIAVPCFGGGVRAVAGGAFDASVRGQPLRWASGAVHYYTDQGKLGILTQDEANALVADAFASWSEVTTAAVAAARDGALDEDVNGGNVFLTDGSLILPADIQPTALAKAIAIVYDDDGTVVETLLGAGSSDPGLCLTNGVLGGPDAYDALGHYQHALLIVNGRCMESSGDLLRMRYMLSRAIGRVLGLGWSQVNDNIVTGTPLPTSLDIAGVPLMHPIPVLCSAGFPGCAPDAGELRMDDRAAISALYPVDIDNIDGFTGKQLFSATTARISGSVRFTLPSGLIGQPMQGVNVIARLVDSQTGIASRVVARSSVSGFRFRGNVGNRATGALDPLGHHYDDFGGDDVELQGYFDLSGLELPAGTNSGEYQVEIEPINPLYIGASAVGAYADAAVTPSGTFAPVKVAVVRGGSVVLTLALAGGARLPQDRLEPDSWSTSRSPVASGEWVGSISGYGDEDFYQFLARAGTTFSVLSTALDSTGLPATNKLMPAVGVWRTTDPSDSAPLVAAGPFNGASPGTTLLQASVNTTERLRFGIMDFRGDGRPDFLYRARLLYLDSIIPAQVAPDQTSKVTLAGIGFRPGMTVRIGGVLATVLHVRANEIGVQVPNLVAGTYAVLIEDASSGAIAEIAAGLRYGAATDDVITDLSIANLSVPVGTFAPNAVRVRVTDAAGNPVSGEEVTFTITPSPSLLSCSSNICAVLTDANGEASVRARVQATGSNGVTAQLSNGASITRGVTGISTGAQLLALAPTIYVTAGGNITIPLAFQYSVNATPAAGVSVTAATVSAGATLTAAAPVTDNSGIANTTLNIANAAGVVNVTACVTATAVCAQVSVLPQNGADLQIVPASPPLQKVAIGEPIAVRFRVTGGAPSFVPVRQAQLTYAIVVGTVAPARGCSEGSACAPGSVRVLANLTGTVVSDATGTVELNPVLNPAWGPVHVSVRVSTSSGVQNGAEIEVLAP